MVNAREGNANAVTLMTIHSAKGLEFYNVFIAGLEEGVLPHQNSLDDPTAIEEERRLMYVAITRAQQNLTLTYCRRNRYKEFIPAQESRFISEIPESCKEYIDQIKKRNFGSSVQFNDQPRKIRSIEKNEFEDPFASDEEVQWRKGQRVAHKLFGEGVINDIQPSSQGFKLKVKFDYNGEKLLIHSFVTPI